MNYEYVGIDEQKTAPLFYRWFDKTDYDTTIFAMEKILKEQFPEVNIGFSRSRLTGFLDRYIGEARKFKKSLFDRQFELWKNYFINKYNYDENDIHAFFTALKEARRDGDVPDTIFKPWTYTGGDVQPAGVQIFTAAKKEIIAPLLLFGIAGIAVYAFFSKGAPQLIKK